MPRRKLEDFRGWGGAQSYPSRTKDVDDVDFSTGSVGLGVAITAFGALVQDYIRARGWGSGPEGRMVALVGDAELDEGNIYECLQEGWKQGLRNCWWIIDYNRQSPRRRGPRRPFGADRGDLRGLRLARGQSENTAAVNARRLTNRAARRCATGSTPAPNSLYSALIFQGGAAWRKCLMDDLGDQGPIAALLDRRSDEDLAALMENLGGHCVETLLDGFDHAAGDDRPTAFVAYTVKGWGTPLAGHKDNHAGLMTPAQMDEFRAAHGIPRGSRVGPRRRSGHFRGRSGRAAGPRALFFAAGPRRTSAPAVAVPPLEAPPDREISTQAAFGKLMDQIAKTDSDLARRIVTTSPDVTVLDQPGSVGQSPWAVLTRGDRRHVPRATCALDAEVALFARWPAHRAGHRRDEPVPAAGVPPG